MERKGESPPRNVCVFFSFSPGGGGGDVEVGPCRLSLSLVHVALRFQVTAAGTQLEQVAARLQEIAAPRRGTPEASEGHGR